MPPLYPTKQMNKGGVPEPDDEHDEVFYNANNAHEELHDDEFLDNISVAMTDRNEAGEFDVETVVDPTSSLVVPLTMSIWETR